MSVEIVVGIDFGTTHTGVSWTYYPSTSSEIYMINNWPDPRAGNANHDKVPSEITYDDQGKPSSWGFHARANKSTAPVKWFKVLMDEEHLQDGLGTETILETTKARLEAIEKTAEDVVIDYLQFVWEFAIETIRTEHQVEITNSYHFRIVITVPAIWNPEAMERTRQAIKGVVSKEEWFNKEWPVEVVQEPTAAAIYTLDNQIKIEPQVIHPGDCYLVCDAGGGTVDLIAFELREKEPLAIGPIAPADGRMCGSILLDRRFAGQVKRIIGVDVFESLPGWRKEKLMRSFEDHLKMGFNYNVTGDETYQVELGGIPQKRGEEKRVDLDEQQLHIYCDELRAVFDPVCSEVWRLISDHKLVADNKLQLEGKGKSINTVLLVGGFAMSNYLYGYLQAKCVAAKLRLVRPHHSVAAVCRGATMWGVARSKASMLSGHQFPVSSTISSCSYGVIDTEPGLWDSVVHGSVDYAEDPLTGRRVIKNQMKWLLQYGEHIYPDAVVKITLSKFVHVEHKWEKLEFFPNDVKFTTVLYYCRGPEMPLQLSRGELTVADWEPPAKSDSGVSSLCTVKVTLKGRQVKKRASMEVAGSNGQNVYTATDGRKMYKVTYDLMLELGNNHLNFKLRHADKDRGSVEVALGDDIARGPSLRSRPSHHRHAVSESKTSGGRVSQLLLIKR